MLRLFANLLSVNRLLRYRQFILCSLAVALCWQMGASYTLMAAPARLPAAQDSPLSPLAAPQQVEAAAADAAVVPIVIATPPPAPTAIAATPAQVASPIVAVDSATATAQGSPASLTLVGLVLMGVLLLVGVVASRQR